MKKHFLFMVIAACAMLFAPSVATAAESSMISKSTTTVFSSVTSQGDKIIVITPDGTVVIIPN